MEAKDIRGMRFGRLIALRFEYSDGVNRYWRFRCDCGTEFVTALNNVTTGKTRSCGCLRKERMREFNKTRDYSKNANSRKR